MGDVVMLSGPIGAGKTAVAAELAKLWPRPLISIEGDRFWPFLVKPKPGGRREAFALVIRSMTAAARPFAKSGYDVLLDFSVPPAFLPVARTILKETPLRYVLVRPPADTCAMRAATREHGQILDYDQGFYDLFAGFDGEAIEDPAASPAQLARRILDLLAAGAFKA